ncbi:GTP-sensing pleiotropic transcriptional regulator CodY [Tumebacillus permanentifrigoris]|uniref:Global transcriptional regulator CodY n=1 Tax=Tumebacillus permanentifrigoris TaxID=378543 RepID=A0A316D5L6_9BACL|nr:GTP-sensing pleiotropic transcriptional regulator CodY [Tumebacillus permanentifrigoris]PWK09057.1 transcriptional pleiotropic repressor [Tumebacillus permanentifrigoris]
MALLEKIQRFNRLLQKSAANGVDFMELAKLLSDMVDSNVYVVGKTGKILGFGLAEYELTLEWNQIMTVDQRFPGEFNENLLKFGETTKNVEHKEPFYVFSPEENEVFKKKNITLVPIVGGGTRLGTLVLARLNKEFSDDDLILAEYGATVVGMEIIRSEQEEIHEKARQRAMVMMALESLSFSEQEAIQHIFKELEGSEGLLVASKIADRVGITRSVIVNAIRKLESAGVIESRSLGMKGTYIKVLNPLFLDQLAALDK